MKATPIASQLKRTIAGVFASSRTDVKEFADEPQLTNYPAGPKTTAPSEAGQILGEHRANLVAAIAQGVFPSMR